MARSLILAWILIFSTATVLTCGQGYYSDTVPYVPAPKKVTHLHFFLHDSLTGKNPSEVMVASRNITNAPSGFDFVFVTSDPLTVGPDISSEIVGHTQGLTVSIVRDVATLVLCWDFGFTKGEFNGSSFSVLSRNPNLQKERELAVVGGTGKFRMATGFAQLKTYFFNSTSGDAIVEYHVTLIHH
ncbi:hypothetical protein PTKIN_Ptkin02bG0210800 [Pterospermum kingtungense]